LDPFGASPRLAIEAARAGYRVLAAVNNPVGRFLIDLHANPPGEEDLRLALAELSAAQKSGERLEPHLRALYRTRCQNCGADVEAQAFVWERSAEAPAARIYTCPNCKDSGERPATLHDAEQARRFAGGALHRARALERVAPLDDPDRAFVEEALLLAAFDACSTLWAHPATRARPRQLITPPRFLERNAWLALEEAVSAWPAALKTGQDDTQRLPLTTWPSQPPHTGGICLFDGRLRDLAGQMAAAPAQPAGPAEAALATAQIAAAKNDKPGELEENAPLEEPAEPIHIAAMLSALPRPNQAFWTLSALWAGWLWGYEASAAFKSVLRRRRYDWDWHAAALQANLQYVAGLSKANLPILGLAAEAEPGFLNAALAAGGRAGLALRGLALRADEAQAQISWETRRSEQAEPPGQAEQLAALAQRSALETLAARGEPCTYVTLHAAIVEQAVQSGQWPAAQDSLEAALAQLNTAIDLALGARERFVRYGSGRALDVGLWWSHQTSGRRAKVVQAPPLADRVEMETVRFLVKHPQATGNAVDTAVCAAFPGRLTPDHELVQQILASYSQAGEDDGRILRSEDSPAARNNDLQTMQALLQTAGKRLGFTVKIAPAPGGRQALRWMDADTQQGYDIFVIASAVAGELLLGNFTKPGRQPVLVLPGGRAALLEYKLNRDPRLHQALAAGWRLVKYRHMRRLAEDPDLTRETLEARLGLDPLENRDPQMTLF
jgi:hypothetical protein